MVRDLDIAAPDPRGGRRLEIVVDGLPLVGGAQFAVDTTLVSIPWSSGLRWRSSGPSEAAQGKNPPEIYPPQARARLVVLASEVAGRRVEQAWRLRWWTMLSCAVARTFAASLLGMRSSRSPSAV